MTSGEESDIARDLSPLITGSGDALPPLLAYGHQDWYLASVRSNDWKLIMRLDGDPRPELYDLRADPGEQQNLSDQQTERLDNLYSRVTTFRRTGAEKAMVEAMEVDREHLEALRSLGYITTYWDKLTRVEAKLISPAPDSTLEGDTAVFRWGARRGGRSVLPPDRQRHRQRCCVRKRSRKEDLGSGVRPSHRRSQKSSCDCCGGPARIGITRTSI